MILSIYSGCGYKLFIIFSVFFALVFKYLHPHINRVLLFGLLGLARGLIDSFDAEYTCRYTSFQADVVDYQLREHKNYLLLSNIKHIKKKSAEYFLDDFAVLPKQALVSVEDIERYKNAKKIECIGRMFFPMPLAKPGVKRISIPRGVIQKGEVVECKTGSFKHYLREKFRSYLREDVANFSSAIFLSDSFSISQNMRENYEKAGLAHVLGVSILNLSIFLIFLYYILYFLIGRCYIKSTDYIPLSVTSKIGSLFFLVLYCYLIGFEYPLLRALFMSCLSVLFGFWGKENNIENLLLVAALICMVEPNAIFDLSFQLSFGGVLGIYALSNIKYKGWIKSSLWTTVSAIALVGPISIFHFQQFCIQPFLSNLLVLPFLGFVLIPSVLVFVFLPGFLASYIGVLINFEFDLLQKLVFFVSKLAINIHFLPVFYPFFIAFIACFLCFSIIKESIRYYFLGLGYVIFLIGVIKAFFFKPFILVNASYIGLVLKDKILVYPKAGFIGEVWGDYYNLPVFDGKNSGYFKNDCGKIIVQNIGIIRSEEKGSYCLPTIKDFVFLPGEILYETKVVYLDD